MAKASDNEFPSLLVKEGTAPASPASGDQRLFIDSADHKLKRVNSSGTVATVEGGSYTDPLTTKGDLVGRSSSATGRLAVGSDGQVLTADAASTLGVKWAAAGGGGGSVNDPRWAVPSGWTTIDEFNDWSLDVAWVRVDGSGAASTNVSWDEGGDVLVAKRLAAGNNTTNAKNSLVRPIGTAPATGDAWITCLTLINPLNTNYSMCGLVICDGTTFGSGKQIITRSYSSTSSAIQQDCIAATNFNTEGTNVGAATGPGSFIPTYHRLVYMGSSQWRFDVSWDGVVWDKSGSNVTVSSFTPSHVGVWDSDGGTATKHRVMFEFLRRTSGIT